MLLIRLQYGSSKVLLVLNNWTPSLFHEANWNIQAQTLKNSLSNIPTHTHRRTDVCLVFAFLWALCFSLCCLCLLWNHKDKCGWRNRVCLVSSCKEPIQTTFKRDASYLQFTLPVWIVIPYETNHSRIKIRSSQNKLLETNPMWKVKVMGGALNQSTPFNQHFIVGDGFLHQANHLRWWVHGFFVSWDSPRTTQGKWIEPIEPGLQGCKFQLKE